MSSTILKKLCYFFGIEFRFLFRFSKKSIFPFRFGFGEISLRSFTIQEGVKPASRSDLVDRLNNLVDIATEMCLHMPINALHKDFMTTVMQLLMSQMQQSNSTKLLPLTFCQKRLLAINMYALNPNVTLQDRLYILKALHSHHPQWSRYEIRC